VSTTLVPDDETCFALFAAATADDVRILVQRADLPYHRITTAIHTAVAA
jgi:uracil DNA glycosylase